MEGIMDKVIKTFIGEIRSVDEKNYTLEAVVSDETIDRYQEVIKVDAWKKGLKNYQKHGVLLSSHNYGTLINQIGIAERVRIEDGKLVAKFKYFTNSGNSEADWGWFLAKQGLAAYSVGFLPRPNGYETASWDDEDVKSGKKPLRTYTDVELLEISQVTVPANPSALQKSMEDEEDVVVKEYKEMVLARAFPTREEIPISDEYAEMIIKDLEEEAETKPDTEGYVHIGVDEGKHTDHKMRTISISKDQGIQAHYCVDCKKVTGYLFDKSKGWTHEKAAAWVEEHTKKDDFEEMLTRYVDEEIEEKSLEEYIEEDRKKKPKPGGCKSEEDEEMILKAIEEFKAEILEKFAKIEEKFEKWDKEDEEYQKDVEQLVKELENQEATEEEEVVLKQLEEDEDYIKSILSEQNELLATKFPVQSN
jgi:phage head maturation protease